VPEGPFAALFARRTLGVRLGLETVHEVFVALGRPAADVPSVHVVGTNGKGSTAACCAHALAGKGRKVGLFTSPHLHRVGERVRLFTDGTAGGVADDDDVLARAIDRVLAVEQGIALPRPLSFFELVTLGAWLRFAEAGVDAIVAEAGMGGRYDATRICNAKVVAITSIDLDHQAYLGPTRAAIAGEKAAVIETGVPCFTGPQPRDVADVLAARAHEVGAPLRWIAPLSRAPIGLVGEHQRANGALGAAAAAVLQPGIVARDVDGVVWPGRSEAIAWRSGTLVLDVAHNPAGIAALAATLARRPDRERLAIAVGCVVDKDADGMLAPLFALDRPVAWVDLRAYDAAGRASPTSAVPTLADASTVQAWIGAKLEAGDTVCVCGSHVLVGALRAAALGLADAAPNDPR
jgi:dihydrofolate synthase / folylpolyglutamate synthase